MERRRANSSALPFLIKGMFLFSTTFFCVVMVIISKLLRFKDISSFVMTKLHACTHDTTSVPFLPEIVFMNEIVFASFSQYTYSTSNNRRSEHNMIELQFNHGKGRILWKVVRWKINFILTWEEKQGNCCTNIFIHAFLLNQQSRIMSVTCYFLLDNLS